MNINLNNGEIFLNPDQRNLCITYFLSLLNENAFFMKKNDDIINMVLNSKDKDMKLLLAGVTNKFKVPNILTLDIEVVNFNYTIGNYIFLIHPTGCVMYVIISEKGKHINIGNIYPCALLEYTITNSNKLLLNITGEKINKGILLEKNTEYIFLKIIQQSKFVGHIMYPGWVITTPKFFMFLMLYNYSVLDDKKKGIEITSNVYKTIYNLISDKYDKYNMLNVPFLRNKYIYGVVDNPIVVDEHGNFKYPVKINQLLPFYINKRNKFDGSENEPIFIPDIIDLAVV